MHTSPGAVVLVDRLHATRSSISKQHSTFLQHIQLVVWSGSAPRHVWTMQHLGIRSGEVSPAGHDFVPGPLKNRRAEYNCTVAAARANLYWQVAVEPAGQSLREPDASHGCCGEAGAVDDLMRHAGLYKDVWHQRMLHSEAGCNSHLLNPLRLEGGSGRWQGVVEIGFLSAGILLEAFHHPDPQYCPSILAQGTRESKGPDIPVARQQRADVC